MSVDLSTYVASQTTPTSQINPSSASTTGATGTAADLASGASSYQSEYQSFLTLLTTQLKNQDPTAPLDPNQFTTELVQMTGVQQQLLSNQLLQSLVNSSPSSGVTSAVGLIGQTVAAASASSNLTNGQASWGYNLPETAASATVSVANAAGTVVYTGQAPSFAQGANTFTWNGQTTAGQPAGSGSYTLSVSATDANGVVETPTISVQGTATSVQNVNGTTEVTVNGAQVPVSSITSIGGS